MVILNLKLNHILAFYDFEVNFSYPSKLRKSLIGNEELSDLPSFRYKKLNIFIGANASGKTSLVKCIWCILGFINKKEKTYIKRIINTEYSFSEIEIDFVLNSNDTKCLHRMKIKTDNTIDDVGISISHVSVPLNLKSSYETSRKELDVLPDNFKDYIEALNEIESSFGWKIVLPATEETFDKVSFPILMSKKEEDEYLYILNAVMQTLDPSIKKIAKSKDADNAYVINHQDTEKIIVQDGYKLSSIAYLSSGTKYGFNIANMIYSIKIHKNGIYLVDEQFSYVNSDVEAAVLSTMVSLLGPDEQLFYTTHNYNIADLKYPFHSFYFMKKSFIDGRQHIEVSCASEAENRNNVVPRSLIDNDVFSTAPDVNKLYEIEESING